MKNYQFGILSALIACALVGFVGRKEPTPCADGKKWFLYKITAPQFPGTASLSDIRNPNNYELAFDSDMELCEDIQRLCAICAIPTDNSVTALPVINSTLGIEISNQLFQYWLSDGIPLSSPLRIIEKP